MAITFGSSLGGASNKTSATTLSLTTGVAVPAGSLVVVFAGSDNLTSSTPTATFSDSVGGNTWTVLSTPTSSSNTANAGAVVNLAVSKLTNALLSTSTITVTLSGAVPVRTIEAAYFNETTTTLRGTAGNASVTTATWSTSITGGLAGDLVIGAVVTQNNAAITGDTDTLNGTWGSLGAINTTGGGATGNISLLGQYKILTASGTQTWNGSGLNTAGSSYTYAILTPGAVSRTATGYGKSDLVDSYSNNNTYATTGVAALANISGASTEYGMSFTGNGKKVRSVVVALKRTGTLTGGATVRIWSHTGTFGSSASSSTPVPGTLLATSGGFLVSGIATSITRYRIDFPVSDQITLTDGTNYYVTVNYTGGSTGNTLDVGYDRTGLTGAGNSAYFPFGGAWTNETTPTDMLFDVEAVTATGLMTAIRTADGSGIGTESATGNRVGPTISRTADGSGQGTETATRAKVKITTARGIGHSAISAQPSSFTNFTVGSGTNFWIAQTFTGTGSVLDSIRINMNENGTVGNTVVFVDIYALTGTLSSGTPTGSVLATSGNVTVPTSAVGPPTFFSFTGANRITLSNGVNYAFIIHWVSGTNAYQVRLSDFDLVPGAYLHSSNSGGSWTIFGAARELIYGVYGADAVGAKVSNRTATGSGVGTETATGGILTAIQRTATGSGNGDSSVALAVTRFRTATGSGLGTSTADTLHNNIRTASGSGSFTAGDTATFVVIRLRTATDSGTGTESATRVIIRIRTASDSGVGAGTATRQVVRIFSQTADGSGTGNSSITVLVKHLSIATGSGIGAGTADTLHNNIRSASGSGSFTAGDTAIPLVIRLKTASGSGAGIQSATRVIIRIRAASGSGNGTESSTSGLTIVRTATGSGLGTEVSVDLLAKKLRLDAIDGTGRLNFNYLSLLPETIFDRSADGSGVGASTTSKLVLRFRSATDSGIGAGTATKVYVSVRQASGSGIGAGTATRSIIFARTATNSGVGSGTATQRRIIIRIGIASAGTGSNTTTNWDILNVYASTNFLVELELTDTPFLSTTVLVLNDATTGKLDFGRTLGARSWYDVTEFVNNIRIERGRSRQLDTFNAGTASIAMTDPTRQFDPTNESSKYYGGVIPRQPIRISANNRKLFTGYIEDWDLNYENPNLLRVTLDCVDAFSVFANVSLDEVGAFAARQNIEGERVDQRITSVLAFSEVAPVAPATSLEIGVVTLDADEIQARTTLLDYLQLINRSEQGYLFMSANNVLTFVARGANSSTSIPAASIPVFTDVEERETDFAYEELGIQFGTELLYNKINVKNSASLVTYTVEDLDSQIDYLVRTLDITDLVLQTDAQAQTLGTYLLNQYSRPTFRYDMVKVAATGITDNRKNRLFDLELADLVRTTKHFTSGTPNSITKYSLIEGISHDISTSKHEIRYNLNTLGSYTPV